MLTGNHGQIEVLIKDFVRRCVVLNDVTSGHCKKIKIHHMNVDRKIDGEVHTVNIQADPSLSGPDIADRVVLEIANNVQDDANSLKAGIQTYCLIAHFEKSDDKPRKIFRVAADEDFDPDGGSSEPPTEKGIVAQLMRHNETNNKNSLVAMGYIIQTFQKEIDQQRGMNQNFLKQQIDMTMLVQDVLNEASKRRIEEKKSEMQMAVWEGLFEHLKVIGPIIANKFLGEGTVPMKMDRELYLMASFLETLGPDVQEFMKNLPPQSLAALAELLEAYEKRKTKFGHPVAVEEEPKNGDSKKLPGIGSNNSLTKLFEKRSEMVKNQTAVQTDDDFTKKIEQTAQAIREKMAELKKDK